MKRGFRALVLFMYIYVTRIWSSHSLQAHRLTAKNVSNIVDLWTYNIFLQYIFVVETLFQMANDICNLTFLLCNAGNAAMRSAEWLYNKYVIIPSLELGDGKLQSWMIPRRVNARLHHHYTIYPAILTTLWGEWDMSPDSLFMGYSLGTLPCSKVSTPTGKMLWVPGFCELRWLDLKIM